MNSNLHFRWGEDSFQVQEHNFSPPKAPSLAGGPGKYLA